MAESYALGLGETMVRAIFPTPSRTLPLLYRPDGHVSPSGLDSLIRMLTLCRSHIDDGAPVEPPIDIRLTWMWRDHALVTPELDRLLCYHPVAKARVPTPIPLSGRYVRTAEGLKWVADGSLSDKEDGL